METPLNAIKVVVSNSDSINSSEIDKLSLGKRKIGKHRLETKVFSSSDLVKHKIHINPGFICLFQLIITSFFKSSFCTIV